MFMKFEQNLWVRFDVFWDDILMVRNIVVSKFAFFDYFNRFLSNRWPHIDPTSTLHRPYQNNQNEEEKKKNNQKEEVEEGKQ